MAILTMKFGGASVGTTTALTQVLSIVLQEHERWDHLLLVVSALDGVTDALIEAAQLAQLSNRRGYRRIVATLRTRHLALVDQLPINANARQALQADIDRLLFDMLDTCQAIANRPPGTPTAAAFDAIVGVGERLAARIVATLLRQNQLRGVAIDATDLIITNDDFGHARPNMQLTRQRIQDNLLPMLGRNIIPVVTGFIGATEAGQVTTLGRGGSDYTASLLAVCADAQEVWIWTDVDGIMTTDPREVSTAESIPELSYDEMAELAYFGARILHARMIGPLREHQVPLRVKNTFHPRKSGTLIHDRQSEVKSRIRAVTTIQGISLTAKYSGPLTRITELIDRALFQTTGNHAEVMTTSQSSTHSFVCFLIPTTIGPEALRATEDTLNKLVQEAHLDRLWQVQTVAVLTIVGHDLDQFDANTIAVLQSLGTIQAQALAQGPGGHSLTIIVAHEDGPAALNRIHACLINSA